MVWELNQGNPTILIAMDDARTGWICISFFMPCATCVQHEALGMVINRHFDGFYPIFTGIEG
jgi:hypothetical protein